MGTVPDLAESSWPCFPGTFGIQELIEIVVENILAWECGREPGSFSFTVKQIAS